MIYHHWAIGESMELQDYNYQLKGTFHLSELTGQTISVQLRISFFLIKTIQPDQSNPK